MVLKSTNLILAAMQCRFWNWQHLLTRWWIFTMATTCVICHCVQWGQCHYCWVNTMPCWREANFSRAVCGDSLHSLGSHRALTLSDSSAEIDLLSVQCRWKKVSMKCLIIKTNTAMKDEEGPLFTGVKVTTRELGAAMFMAPTLACRISL